MSKARGENAALHKIGVVSSRSGVPAPTLRVWEARHGTFAPSKSKGQHRLYSDADVLRATLLKRLVDQGHAISNIGKLDTPALHALLLNQTTAQSAAARTQESESAVAIAIVGLALATRIESKKFTLTFHSKPVKVTDVFIDMAQAMASHMHSSPDILLVKFASLHARSLLDLHTLAAHCGAPQVIVLYNFGPEHVVDVVKSAGMLVRREPLSDSDLSELIQAAQSRQSNLRTEPFALPARSGPRQYSDETLATVAAMPSTVVCECPRHVAEIISQLASFEQYSQECLNASKEDAQLHAYLSSVSGSARALFERALQVIAEHEGIALPREGP